MMLILDFCVSEINIFFLSDGKLLGSLIYICVPITW